MYTRFFGLTESPFALTPDPRYLYLSHRHQEALAHLRYGITQGGGFVQLTGEVGTGKTLMIRTLLEQLPAPVDVALILYPFLSVREFVAAICHDLGIERPADDSLKSLIDALNAYLLDRHARGRRTVLIIDEAQNLSHEVLEQVRLLTNLETHREKLLQILLIGQPELNQLLAQPDLRQLAQRITARYSLAPLSQRETEEYVHHRCRVAGARTVLFSPAALRAVHRFSGGTPRLINVVCDRALLGTYAVGQAQVSGAIVRRAAAEIGSGARAARPRRRRLAAAAGVAALAAGLAAWQFAPGLIREGLPGAGFAAGSAAPVVAAKSAAVERPARPDLAALLSDPAMFTEAEAAFAALLARWRLDYARLAGKDGCERAAQAGLRCLALSGTWNNLRQFNLPAVLELRDRKSSRHHVLVTALQDDRVTLELAGRPYEFTASEVDRYWYGRFQLVWMSPGVEENTLRRGARGPAVLWLRAALVRAGGTAAAAGELFDAALEEQVKAFQRAHRLTPDGVVGQLTLVQLAGYDPRRAPPRLWTAARAGN